MKNKLILLPLAILTSLLLAKSASALTKTQLYNNAANNIFFYLKDDSCTDGADYVPTVTGDQMTWIGDAYSVYARLAIETRFPGVTIHAEKGRNISETSGVESGIDVVKRLAEGNALRKYVAFMLGTNGGDNKSEDEVSTIISDLLSVVGDDRIVILMTPYTRSREYKNFNKVVREIAEKNDRVLLADWATQAKDKIDEYFEAGNNSMTERGLNMLVAVVGVTLDKYAELKKGQTVTTVGTTLGTTVTATPTSADSDANALIVAKYLFGAGYDADSVAGILGNLQGESGIIPNKLEGGKLVTDTNWRIKSWEKYGKKGFGIAQWTVPGRQDKLQDFADKNGLPIIGLEAQIGHLLDELKAASYKSRVEDIKGKGIAYATFNFWRYFETPGSSFWTTHEGKYYNDCATTGLETGSCPLSESRTPAAYESFTTRLGYAKHYLELIESSGLGEGSGITWTGGGSAGPSGSLCSTTAQGSTALAMLAREMSWPTNEGTCQDSSGGVHQWKDKSCYPNPRDKYRQVVNELKTKGVNIPKFMDCSYFIASVIRYSGLDDDWPAPGGSEPAWRYANGEKGQQKWLKIPNIGNSSNLMPGDVFTYPRANDRPGHVMMYIGEYGGKHGDMAGASLDNNVAIVGNIYFTHADNGSGAGTKFTISRYKGSGTVDLGTGSGDGEGDGDEGGDDESEPETPSAKNSCKLEKVSTGKVYEGTKKDDEVVKLLGRAVNKIAKGDKSHAKVFGSYLLIQYERDAGTGASASGLKSWLTNKYQSSITGDAGHQYEPTDATKTTLLYLMTSGTRVLPANTREMLAPSGVTWIKPDGTNSSKIKGNLAKKADLDKLVAGTSKGTITGYNSDLDFFCATKDSTGNYVFLFWQYSKTPAGQEDR